MNQKNWLKWARALESGKYKQGHYNLQKAGRYCCLGVACELAIADGVEIQRKECSESRIRYDDASCYLQVKVQNWLGITVNDPCLGDRPASYMNDIDNATFPEIAKAIRAEVRTWKRKQKDLST